MREHYRRAIATVMYSYYFVHSNTRSIQVGFSCLLAIVQTTPGITVRNILSFVWFCLIPFPLFFCHLILIDLFWLSDIIFVVMRLLPHNHVFLQTCVDFSFLTHLHQFAKYHLAGLRVSRFLTFH